MKIKLKKCEIDYLINADFIDNNLKNSIKENVIKMNDLSIINLPEDIELRLYEILQHQLPKIGFDKDYDLTKEGKIIENIMDKLGDE